MPTVRDVLAVKGTVLHTTQTQATVLDATRVMNQHKIGALVVMEGDRVVGMFTERDVLQRVVAQEIAPATVKVGEVMTREIVCCLPDDDLDEVSAIMKQKRVRHVPVCDSEGTLHGMVSMGDVNAQYASNAEQQIHFLNEYIYGRA